MRITSQASMFGSTIATNQKGNNQGVINSPVKGFHHTSQLNGQELNYERSPEGIF